MTKFPDLIGVLLLFMTIIHSPLIRYIMKIFRPLVIVGKFVYYLIKNIGYQPFVDAWKKATAKNL